VAPEAVAAKSRAVGPSNRASGNIIFILDASGSMWGQVEGTAKIAIAKEVLTGLVRDLPDDAMVGLVAYGHRRKGDCDDVEELVALGPLDKEKIVGRIQDLSPKGKTPISRSVRLTDERIKDLKDETTIILVSDGKETCDPDPCTLVRDLSCMSSVSTLPKMSGSSWNVWPRPAEAITTPQETQVNFWRRPGKWWRRRRSSEGI
jgi:Ca-activated chloride channel family protein